MAVAIGQAVLDDHPRSGSLLRLVWRAGLALQTRSLARILQQDADATVLRGLLALEVGETDEAEAAFAKALAIYKDEAAAASGSGVDFDGRVIAQDCLDWLE
jgi:hypothetical protein